MSGLSLRHVVKDYDQVRTVHGIDLEIADGEFVVLVGPSGCGKSTTLRMIAGLESVTDGDILIGGRRVNGLPPGERDIAMVFQNYALYPHLTVADNITFGLRLRKTPREDIRKRLAETAALLEIAPLLGRKPRQLSGGQRQRVAMGRAIIRNPRVFLFDEPLSNLDAQLRVQMRAEIKQLHTKIPTTTIYVTHDQVEAMTLADRVVVMNGGRIEQIADPQDLYLKPATRFVAGFIGSPGMNFLPVTIETASGTPAARLATGALIPLARSMPGLEPGRRLLLGVRPEHFRLAPADEPAPPSAIEVMLTLVEPLGMETLVHFAVADTLAVARLPPDARLRTGNPVALHVETEKLHLIDPETDLVLLAATTG
jgi:multiple sugar transport system ATP-binding protein